LKNFDFDHQHFAKKPERFENVEFKYVANFSQDLLPAGECCLAALGEPCRGGLQRKNQPGGPLPAGECCLAALGEPCGGAYKEKTNRADPFPQGNVASLRSASPAGGPTKKKQEGLCPFYYSPVAGK
jgi:hypothetical protein